MSTEKDKEVRGQDLDAPTKEITIDGKTYPLRFNNRCIRVAEDVYAEQYGKEVNFGAIIRDLGAAKLNAIMAVYYAAMIAGGNKMTWEEFDEKFTIASLPGVHELVMQAVAEAMPKSENKEEADQKDPQTAAQEK